MKILCIAPGHPFATTDVFDGLCAGLRLNDVEVVVYRFDAIIRMFYALVKGAELGGAIVPNGDAQTNASEFSLWLGAADALAMALDHEVAAVVVVNGLLIPPERMVLLRKLGIPVACIGTEAPYQIDRELTIAPAYTHWFTNERREVWRFSRLTHAAYLPHAYNGEIHRPGPARADYESDVCFVGSGFPERKRLIGGVDWRGIRLALRGTLWDGRTQGAGAIGNDEACDYYRGARIVLNHHRTSTYHADDVHIAPGTAESLGPRAYEIAACGAFQLCDDSRPEYGEVFGEAAITYRAGDSADMEKLIRYYLAHDDERLALAAAQHEAIQPHSWRARAADILNTLTL
jgi:spore maturation protein CgeB